VQKWINIEIDKLTHSIENRVTGDKFNTQVLPITANDFKHLKKTDWNFDWQMEFNALETKVFKLIVESNLDVIQGLISLNYKEGFVFV